MEINKLYNCDCIDYLKTINEQFIDLIYIDPPFNTGINFGEFNDNFNNNNYYEQIKEDNNIPIKIINFIDFFDKLDIKNYLSFIAHRIYYMHKSLKSTGSFYVHTDENTIHYIRFITDIIFGMKNFRNEIVWWYFNKFSNRANSFIKNHDIIFFYSKSDNYIYNKIEKIDYEITKSAERNLKSGYHIKSNDKKLIVYDKEKSINKIKECAEKGFKIKYQDNKISKYEDDVWNIMQIPSQSNERLGYPTQKPEALLERIIKASSDPGDLVADFFLGSGTTIAVANKLNRKYIGTDININSIKITNNRLLNNITQFN